MPAWKRLFLHVAEGAETRFDALRGRLRARLTPTEPFMIAVYNGYGTRQGVRVRGRILEENGVRAATDNDSVWRNLVNVYRRFDSDEIAHAQVRLQLGNATSEVTTNDEGYFEALLHPRDLPADRFWHDVTVTLLSPVYEQQGQVVALGRVMVPQPDTRFLIISDLDDTVVRTDATNLLKMARTVFLGNARTRLPFPGVAAFYRALHRGSEGPFVNPLFYVSSSPWNLYDMLADFLDIQGIPSGALMLRDWGLGGTGVPSGHLEYKLGHIRAILADFPDMPVLLIGDSGQEDPEIYRQVVREYPEQVLGIYIRNVSKSADRIAAIERLAEEVAEAGTTLMLTPDTLTAARHAAEKGWIELAALDEIVDDKARDEGQPSAEETLLDEPDEPISADTTDVEAGTVADAMQERADAGEPAPSIVVEDAQVNDARRADGQEQ